MNNEANNEANMARMFYGDEELSRSVWELKVTAVVLQATIQLGRIGMNNEGNMSR